MKVNNTNLPRLKTLDLMLDLQNRKYFANELMKSISNLKGESK